MVSEALVPEFRRLVSEKATFTNIAGGLLFTEGPVWNHLEGYLVWLDIIGDAIWKWVPVQGKSLVMHPSAHAKGTTCAHEGRLIVAGWSNRTVWRLEKLQGIVCE